MLSVTSGAFGVVEQPAATISPTRIGIPVVNCMILIISVLLSMAGALRMAATALDVRGVCLPFAIGAAVLAIRTRHAVATRVRAFFVFFHVCPISFRCVDGEAERFVSRLKQKDIQGHPEK